MPENIIVRTQELSKNYETEAETVHVLRNINLLIKQGESIVLSGVSGSGKSTLLNILGGIDRASGGMVEVCSQDLNKLSQKEQTAFRAKNIGFIFQFFNLIPTLTVLENVKSALEPIVKNSADVNNRSILCLTELGLDAHCDKFPNQLSGGEQQRVSIARAIVKKPSFIIADEPTGNLDSENAMNVMKILKELQYKINSTLIIATHDPLISKFADRKLTIENNTIIEIT